MKYNVILVCVALILCFVQSSRSLKCYGCLVYKESGDSCVELNTKYMPIRFCEADEVCVKSTMKWHGKDMINRACMAINTCAQLQESPEENMKVISCRECEEDLCNSASGAILPIFLMISAIILKFYY